MIFIPFIFFSCLFIFIVRKNKRIEISALITGAYLLTSFFAIVIDVKHLYGAAGSVKSSINLVPALLYCVLISLTIVPFIRLPQLNRNNVIPIHNLKLFDRIVYFYFLIFILFIYFFGNEIIFKVQNPDIAGLRILIVDEGDDLGFQNYSGITRVIARLVFMFSSSAMFLHVFYFYSIAFLKKSSRFNLGILIFSAMPIMIGMLALDRSKMVYWIMSFIVVAVFFWPCIDSSRKRRIKSTFMIFFVLFMTYLATITIARYGEQDIGATDSLIVYAGQSFNNFCLFYDKLHLPGISLERVAPLFESIINPSNEISREDLYSRTIDTAVFASFSGILIREVGVIGSILYSLIYFIIATIIFKKVWRYNITNIFLIVLLLYIPYLGIFGVYYGTIDREIAFWGVLVISYYLRKGEYVNRLAMRIT